MKRQSVGAFALKVSGWLTCVAAATATVAAGGPSAQNTRAARIGEKAVAEHGSKGGGAAQFVTMKPCTTSDSSRFRFVTGRNPFMGGGGGAYGDIFFAGGGSSRAMATAGPGVNPATPPSPQAPAAAAPTPAPVAGTPQPPAAGPQPVVTAPPVATTPAPETPALVAVRDPDTPAPAGGGDAIPVPTTGSVAAPGGTGPAPVTAAAPSAVNPEPASLMLIGLGLSGIAVIRKRQNRS